MSLMYLIRLPMRTRRKVFPNRRYESDPEEGDARAKRSTGRDEMKSIRNLLRR